MAGLRSSGIPGSFLPAVVKVVKTVNGRIWPSCGGAALCGLHWHPLCGCAGCRGLCDVLSSRGDSRPTASWPATA